MAPFWSHQATFLAGPRCADNSLYILFDSLADQPAFRPCSRSTAPALATDSRSLSESLLLPPSNVFRRCLSAANSPPLVFRHRSLGPSRMKALLFVLLRSYAFAPAPSHSDQIVHRQSIVQKPVRLGRENDGASMPLRVTRA